MDEMIKFHQGGLPIADNPGIPNNHEARAALLLGAMNIQFVPQPADYFLDGSIYIPTFYLPQVHMHMEVSGKNFTSREMRLIRSMVVSTRIPVILFVGLPDLCSYPAIEPAFQCEGEDESEPLEGCHFSLDVEAHNRVYLEVEHRLFCDGDEARDSYFSPEYRRAVAWARTFRFDNVTTTG